jgi:hypothetical protein
MECISAGEAREMSVEELFSTFHSGFQGLSASEVSQRIEILGYNKIPEKHISPVVKFAGYFWGPIPPRSSRCMEYSSLQWDGVLLYSCGDIPSRSSLPPM